MVNNDNNKDLPVKTEPEGEQGPAPEPAFTESESKYRTLIESSTDAILMLDAERNIVSCNQAFLALFQYHADEVIGQSIRIIHSSDESYATFGNAAYPVLEEINSFRTEWDFVSKEGDFLALETVTSPIREAATGTTRGYVAILRDVGDRKKIDRALRVSEESLRTIVDSVNDAIFIHRADGHIVYVNARMLELYRVTREEAMDHTMVADYSAPDNPLHLLPERFNRVLAGEDLFFGWKARRPGDGSVFDVEVSLRRIWLVDGHFILATVRDISERIKAERTVRESDEKYRNIFENATEGIFQTTPEGTLLSANPALARMYGFETPEELTAVTPGYQRQTFVNPEDGELFERLLVEQGSVEGFEAMRVRKDGSKIWTSVNARIVRGSKGEIAYYEGTVEDITARKQFESQFLQAQKMEAIGTLAGGIAHDFNNLLMGIQGYTSLMLSGFDPAHPFHEYLQAIEKQVRRGADLTKELLGFARRGKYEINRVNAREIVEKTSGLFGRTRKEITIHQTQEDQLWTVEADSGQMEQALLNIFINAWEAMPAGGDLYIDMANVVLGSDFVRPYIVKPGRYVRISIRDTGKGMDENTKKRIFEPFFTTKEMGRGTGLGLASVYGIVKNHGGFIDVWSEKGRGTMFSVYFPASQVTVEVAETAVEGIRYGNETILLVDDEEMVADVARKLLEALGYKVFVAHSGREAIDIYLRERKEIALVMLDMIMPGLAGGETFEFLKQINPDVKVILSSGYSLEGQASSIMESGCKSFIQKPYGIDELSRKIRDTLDS
jgi:two-component system, cell cycle sensor histidine kinase and response regulator CckA